MLTIIATFFGGINLRTKVLTALGILFLFTVFMAVKTSRDAGKREVLEQVEAASQKATVEALESQIEATAKSETRQEEFEHGQDVIEREIERARDDGSDPVSAYFDGLRKANSRPKDQPAD